MNIRKANTEDAARIFSFVKEAVNKMDGQGINQWDEFYRHRMTLKMMLQKISFILRKSMGNLLPALPSTRTATKNIKTDHGFTQVTITL